MCYTVQRERERKTDRQTDREGDREKERERERYLVNLTSQRTALQKKKFQEIFGRLRGEISFCNVAWEGFCEKFEWIYKESLDACLNLKFDMSFPIILDYLLKSIMKV